jgi:hypothetical protein
VTEPTSAETPEAPKRKPNLLERFRALWRPETGPTVQPLMSCSHRWPNGTSAWVACTWNGSAWITHCARCGLYAYCR